VRRSCQREPRHHLEEIVWSGKLDRLHCLRFDNRQPALLRISLPLEDPELVGHGCRPVTFRDVVDELVNLSRQLLDPMAPLLN
jgi:hypothetical protein